MPDRTGAGAMEGGGFGGGGFGNRGNASDRGLESFGEGTQGYNTPAPVPRDTLGPTTTPTPAPAQQAPSSGGGGGYDPFAAAQAAHDKVLKDIADQQNKFQNLSGETLIASGLKNYALQHDARQTALQRQFSQRGINSPAQDFIQSQDNLRSAEATATLRNEAPLKVATAKQSFLTHNVANPAAAQVENAQTNQLKTLGSQATLNNNSFQSSQDRLANIYNADNALAQNELQYQRSFVKDQRQFDLKQQNLIAQQDQQSGQNSFNNLLGLVGTGVKLASFAGWL